MIPKWWVPILFASVAARGQNPVTLEWSVRTALSRNPGLRAAETETRSAREDTKQARTSFFPSLDASGSFKRQSTVPQLEIPAITRPFGGGTPFSIFPEGGMALGLRDTYDFRITLSQPLFTGFRLIHRKKMAVAFEETRRMEEAQKRSELVFRVETAFGTVLKTEKVLEIAKSGRDQVGAHLADVEKFFGLGLIKKDELLKARVKCTEADVAVLQAKNGMALATAALENAIGESIPPGAVFEWTPEAESPAVDGSESIQRARSERPELAAVRSARRAAEAGKGLARGGVFPSIALFGSLGYGKPGLDFIGKKWMDYWVVGAGAEWNLWSWGKTRSQMRQADLKSAGLSETQRQVEEGIVLEVTQACLRLDEARERLILTAEMEAQAKESYRVAENFYTQGQSSHTEFFDAQSECTRARLARAQAEIDLMLAFANWRRAVGESANAYQSH
jgi:outer membrane protein